MCDENRVGMRRLHRRQAELEREWMSMTRLPILRAISILHCHAKQRSVIHQLDARPRREQNASSLAYAAR
jgi:hypothetical protein